MFAEIYKLNRELVMLEKKLDNTVAVLYHPNVKNSDDDIAYALESIERARDLLTKLQEKRAIAQQQLVHYNIK